MTEQEFLGNGAGQSEPFRPTFSAKTRTRVYVGGLVAGAVAFLGAGVSAIYNLPELGQVFGLVGTALPTIAAGFGVAYRPTK